VSGIEIATGELIRDSRLCQPKEHDNICCICKGDKETAMIAIRLGHRPDVAFAKLRQAKQSFESIWDTLTDMLTQNQIDRIEELHKNDLDNLFIG
jgi:hypothetical protein